MSQRKHKIVLCGHYGSTNIGDEAIGLGIVQTIKKYKPGVEISILSYDPSRTMHFFRIYEPNLNIPSVFLVPLGIRSIFRGIFKGELRRTLKKIKDCDTFIIGGGGLFTDERLFAVFLWGIHALLAYLYRKKVFMIAQSIGPLKSKIGKWITYKVFNRASYISVRDKESKNTLKNIGIKNEIFLTSDAAFGINFDGKIEHEKIGENLNKKLVHKGYKGYFIISFRPWTRNLEQLNNIIVQRLRYIVEKHKLIPVFIPFQLIKENDKKTLNKIVEQNQVNIQFKVMNYTDDIFKVLDVISSAKFMIGVRLHSLLFAILMNVPFLGVSYSDKIKNLIKDINLSEYILFPEMDEHEITTKIENFIKNINKNKKISGIYSDIVKNFKIRWNDEFKKMIKKL